uniref:Oxidative stress-responsive serine-rich protein 1 n=2 Tax=Tetraodon nigroviridis TaxID=99883 RepID=H3CI63_TETNG
PSSMEAGGKDGEEETLQSAFKKLRVDAERHVSSSACSVPAEPPRSGPRSALDLSGAKPKLGSLKDTWHSCLRKTSRGASRTQRRRRSKSPILHPPKFTYCGAAAPSPLVTAGGSVKQQRLAVPEPAEPRPLDGGLAQVEHSTQGHASTLLFGSPAKQEVPAAVAAATRRDTGSSREAPPSGRSSPDCVRLGGDRTSGPEGTADFRALSQDEDGRGAECRCPPGALGWAGVEVYSFTGLREVISECERSLASHDHAPRTASSSPRSCSEQARAYIDDITIEDLSGYMEYYLYIPKKMSHMAEMMYT